MNSKTKSAAKTQATSCSIFGNQYRVVALWALVEGEMSVGDIAKSIGSSLQNTSQHLRLMKDRGVVVSRRDGQTIYYSIAQDDLINNCQIMLQTHHINRKRE